MKEDEKKLLQLIFAGSTPCAALTYLGIPLNRARYLLEDKWSQKDWYDYGVSWDLGWLTEEGKVAARETLFSDAMEAWARSGISVEQVVSNARRAFSLPKVSS